MSAFRTKKITSLEECTLKIKMARKNRSATLSATGIKKALDNQGLNCVNADRTGNLNLILTYPKLMKPSNIKGLPLYSSHLNMSKLTKIGGSSYGFCYTVSKCPYN